MEDDDSEIFFIYFAFKQKSGRYNKYKIISIYLVMRKVKLFLKRAIYRLINEGILKNKKIDTDKNTLVFIKAFYT